MPGGIPVMTTDRISSAHGGFMAARETATTAGIGFGSALAMILSFQLNHSILWAILHGVFSWFYVVYRAIRGNY